MERHLGVGEVRDKVSKEAGGERVASEGPWKSIDDSKRF